MYLRVAAGGFGGFWVEGRSRFDGRLHREGSLSHQLKQIPGRPGMQGLADLIYDSHYFAAKYIEEYEKT